MLHMGSDASTGLWRDHGWREGGQDSPMTNNCIQHHTYMRHPHILHVVSKWSHLKHLHDRASSSRSTCLSVLKVCTFTIRQGQVPPYCGRGRTLRWLVLGPAVNRRYYCTARYHRFLKLGPYSKKYNLCVHTAAPSTVHR